MADPALNRARSNRRRAMMPIIILIAAGVVGMWTTTRSNKAATVVKADIQRLVAPNANAANTGLPGLDVALLDLSTSATTPVVTVEPGDQGPFNDGNATHTVLIYVDGVARLGLRVVHENTTRIIGFWRPGDTEGELMTEGDNTGSRMPIVWLNGSFVDPDAASISVFDAGLQHAVGLFETMVAVRGRVFRGMQHLTRLAQSANELRLTDRLQVEPLLDALHLAVGRSQLNEVRIRLTVTGGNLNMLQSSGMGPVDPTILIVVQPPTAYPDAFFSQGVRVTIADGRDNPFDPMAGHKTLSYWHRIHALQQAAGKRAGEALWFSVSNHLSCGSVSNVFLVKDRQLLTPIARGEEEQGALPSPVRPGVTREVIEELANEASLEVHKRMLDIEQVLAADEMFLTNSSWGVLPVVGVEAEEIGDGTVGPVTQQLRKDWLDRLEDETTDDPI